MQSPKVTLGAFVFRNCREIRLTLQSVLKEPENRFLSRLSAAAQRLAALVVVFVPLGTAGRFATSPVLPGFAVLSPPALCKVQH